MSPTETAEQLRLMRTRAVLCYNTTPSGPVYSIHATVPGLGVLSSAADLIEAQAAQIEELREEVKRARENEQAALDRAARARLDFKLEFQGKLQEAVAAERAACAAIAHEVAEDICYPIYSDIVQQLARRISRRSST